MTINERFQTIIEQLYNGNQSAFAKAIDVSPTVIANVVGKRQGKPSFDVIEKIYANANVSPRWLISGIGDMIDNSTVELSIDPKLGKPYYNVDFIGGFNEIINSQVTVPEANIIIQGFEKADLWCNVTGHSMEPKISHGDIIALHKCAVKDIQFGEIYAVVTDTIRTIKIIRKSSTPGMLRFVPINIENFDEKEYKMSDILYIYEVIGSISKFF